MKKIFYLALLTTFFVYTSFALAQSPFGDPAQPIGTNEAAGVGQDSGGGEAVGPNQAAGSGDNAGTSLSAGQSNQAGNADNAGSGADTTDQQQIGFWASILENLGLGNQNSDKNNETDAEKDKVIEQDILFGPDKDQYDISGKSGRVNGTYYTTKSKVSCSIPEKTIRGYLQYFTCIIVVLIPIVIAATVLFFMWGSFKLINNSDNEGERSNYKVFLMWGIIILFVILSFVGIIKFFGKTLGI